ncbi:kappa-casein [Tamandua tetradactyla]|uniref:kappa-casein n=1 Tax=Tamandua tetradactyla TaxID=48850 RepID=UPI004053AF8E
MKIFLVVNILALTLPFLAAEVQKQEQPICHENNGRQFCQKKVKYVPIHYAVNSYSHYGQSYYQPSPAITINNPYLPHTKPVAVRPHALLSQWSVLSSAYPSPVIHHTYLHPSFIFVSTKKIQEKAPIPTINTIATVGPTPVPTTEPAVATLVASESSSESFITSTPEATTVPATSPTV